MEDLDEAIQLQIEAATETCELRSGRALRSSHTIVQKYCCWPDDPIWFDRQPVLAISTVKYYDTDNSLQTYASSNYVLVTSTDAASKMWWATTATLPTVYDRPDAVQITYTAGYSTVPVSAKHAILAQLSLAWGDLTEGEYRATERLLEGKLADLNWGCVR